jgi:DNA-binding CsgD family transcriptional regulator
MASDRRHFHAWAPAWAERLGIPVWVRDPHGRISFVNGYAAQVLRRDAKLCLEQPCAAVVAGRDVAGRSFCGANCPIVRLARQARELRPVMLRVEGASRAEAWLNVLHTTVDRPDASSRWPDASDPWIVHCAIDAARNWHMEHYLRAVTARRARAMGTAVAPPSHTALTRRERQIMDLLTEGHRLPEIAERLGISYTTVRNHVQNILSKQGTHSILQAVAFDLLSRSDKNREEGTCSLDQQK